MKGMRKINGKYYTLYERVGCFGKTRATEIAKTLRNNGFLAAVVKWGFGENYIDDYAVYYFPTENK